MYDAADVVDDDVARPSDERSDLRSVAKVVGAVVVAAQCRLIAPNAEQHELTRLVACKDAEVDAFRLGAAGVGQLDEERAQFGREADTSVDVGNQHYVSGHREPRV
jgi:hypothetical protein